jgi:hypothetical protein
LTREQPKVGEIWTIAPPADPDGTRAIVCVLDDGDGSGACLSVAFTDSQPEYATDQHLIYEPGEATLWELRVALDVVGPVGRGQFLERVGVLPESASDLVDAIWDADFPLSLATRRGLPIRGANDARLIFDPERIETNFERWLAPGSDDD